MEHLQQFGTYTLQDTFIRPLFGDLLMLQLLRPVLSNLPCLFSIFHLEYPLNTLQQQSRNQKYKHLNICMERSI